MPFNVTGTVNRFARDQTSRLQAQQQAESQKTDFQKQVEAQQKQYGQAPVALPTDPHAATTEQMNAYGDKQKLTDYYKQFGWDYGYNGWQKNPAFNLGAQSNSTLDKGQNAAIGAYAPAANAAADTTSQLGQTGYLENLYNKRAAGEDADYNAAYANQMQQGMATIGQNSAYSGHLNSGGNATREGAFQAGLAGQRANEMGQLAQGAQAEKSGRLGQIFNENLGVGAGQAGIYTGTASQKSQMDFNSQLAAIEAKFRQEGMDQNAAHQKAQEFLGTIGLGTGLIGMMF